MRNTNLFILFNMEIEIESFEITEALEYVPFLVKDQSHVQQFRGCVMTHDIVYRGTTRRQGLTARPTMSFVLLHRHLHHLFRALSCIRWAIGAHDEVILHTVTLLDLCRSQNHDEAHASFTRKMQEELVAPYRSGMTGFPNFTLKGAMQEELETAVTLEVTLMPEFYTASQIRQFIDDKRNLTRWGVQHYQKAELDEACTLWNRCLTKINADFASATGDRLQRSGGADLLHELADLYTAVLSSIAHATSVQMETQLAGHPRQLLRAADAVASASQGRTRWLARFAHRSTWRPTAAQSAELCYREALCARLSNEPRYLPVARNKIAVADRLMPGAPVVRAEQAKIERAIRELATTAVS